MNGKNTSNIEHRNHQEQKVVSKQVEPVPSPNIKSHQGYRYQVGAYREHEESRWNNKTVPQFQLQIPAVFYDGESGG